jgi:hypothetical protein
MRIYDLKATDGSLRAFEVENALLTRGRVCRLAESIPGATLVRRSRLFRDTDDFCEFTLGGQTFVIEEPFGDNSRYWVGAKEQPNTSSLLVVRQAFEQHNAWKTPFRIVIAVLLLALGLATYPKLTKFVAKDRCLDEGGKWHSVERTCEKAKK